MREKLAAKQVPESHVELRCTPWTAPREEYIAFAKARAICDDSEGRARREIAEQLQSALNL